MTKVELIERFAECNSFESKAEAKRAFDLLKEIITETLLSGEDVSLGTNFGTLKVVKLSATSGKINGNSYSVPARNTVKFRISEPFKKEMIERTTV